MDDSQPYLHPICMEASYNNRTCAITNAQVKFYETYSWWMGGICSVCIAPLGIIFNTIAISILCHKKMRSSFFNRLLVCLAVEDTLFLLLTISDALGMQLIKSYGSVYPFIFVNLVYPARSMLMFCSIYMTVGLACERYHSTSNVYLRQDRQNENTCRRFLMYTTPVITFSILYSIPKFFDLKVREINSNCSMDSVNETIKSNNTEYAVQHTKIRENHDYVLWYINILHLVVAGIIPFVLLTVLYYKIYKSLKQRRLNRASIISRNLSRRKEERKKETRQTFVLFSIIVLFGMCHALRVILNIEELAVLEKSNEQRKQGCAGVYFWAVVALPISTLLLQLNSCTVFFVYCVCDDIFKEVLKTKILQKRDFVYVQNTPTTTKAPPRNRNTLSAPKKPIQDIALHELQ